MYKILRVIGVLVRSYMLTNAFEYFFDNLIIAYVINMIIGEVLLWQTTYYISVGSIYVKKSNPALGSFLYTLFYVINNFLLIGSCYFCKKLNLDLLCVVLIYMILLIFEVWVSRKSYSLMKEKFGIL